VVNKNGGGKMGKRELISFLNSVAKKEFSNQPRYRICVRCRKKIQTGESHKRMKRLHQKCYDELKLKKGGNNDHTTKNKILNKRSA
jgi:hypothetical protein